VLFNEPKLLKFTSSTATSRSSDVSVLFNEPKLLKYGWTLDNTSDAAVSVLFNEPKLLKLIAYHHYARDNLRFSALQRAEIAEISPPPT